MKKFKKLVVLDKIDTTSEALDNLHHFAEEVKIYNDFPNGPEINERLKDADAVVLSWKTILTEKHIEKAENLKYIGLAASFYGNESSNVAADYAGKKGIIIKGIFDYGDPGVVEFILSETIQLLNGYGQHQWKKEVQELAGQKFGIIGLGTTGQLLAKALLALDVDVYYFSKTRKPDWEEKGIHYLALEDLAKQCSIISVHLPKNTKILTEAIFKKMPSEKILINTSLGLPFRQVDFQKWIKGTGNFAIFDGDGSSGLKDENLHIDRIISRDQSAGWSEATKRRRGEKVLKNLELVLGEINLET
jgi:hypothetical protein